MTKLDVLASHAELLPVALDTVKAFHVPDAMGKEEQSTAVVGLLLLVHGKGAATAETRLEILKDIADISVDARAAVRTSGFGAFQKQFLSAGAQSASELRASFEEVLCPLLQRLAGAVSAPNDEIRVRGFNLLCQMLLVHLAILEQLQDFAGFWFALMQFVHGTACAGRQSNDLAFDCL
eukprot:SAG31_NODE_5641_length_2408_cov_12.465497_2_plen_179_part_00